MKNKKGFTLIELLAVIVILAVIALIATPIIMNVINDAKKGAAKDSTYGYIKAVELASTQYIVKNGKGLSGNYITKSGNLYNSNTKVLDVSVSGKKPADNGSVTLDKGKITKAELTIDGLKVKYDGAEVTVGDEESTNPTPTATPEPTEVPSSNINPNTSVANVKEVIPEGDTYTVYNSSELNYIAKIVNEGNSLEGKTVILGTDIDMEYNEYIPIGISREKSFKGTFDGRGNAINNLKIDTTYDYSGLFGYVGENGVITAFNINNTEVSGNNYVGSVAGYVAKTASVKNVNTHNLQVSGNNYVGGVVGDNNGSISELSIQFNHVDSNIVSGHNYIGGLIGYNKGSMKNSLIENGIISGNDYIGGIVGYNVENTLNYNAVYFTTIRGKSNVGEVVGSGSVGTDNGTRDNIVEIQ